MIREFLHFFSTLPEGHTMTNFLGVVATYTCVLFAGAFVYVSLVEHPARLDSPMEVAVNEWRLCHRRATVLQSTLALVAIVAGCARWFFGHHANWLLGAMLIVFVVVFSYLFVAPTNERLLASASDPSATTTHELLAHWGKLNAVRTLASLAASLVYLDALTAR